MPFNKIIYCNKFICWQKFLINFAGNKVGTYPDYKYIMSIIRISSFNQNINKNGNKVIQLSVELYSTPSILFKIFDLSRIEK